MATNFPTSLDTLTNPTSTDRVSTVDHAAQHANANDAIEALQVKVGIDGSAVTATHDYKLSSITGSAKAVSTTGNQTVSGVKTFDTGGVVVTGAELTTPKVTTSINDSNNNEALRITATGSAVNEVNVTNATTGNGPSVTATGGDTNIDLNITGKGTGSVRIGTAGLRFPNADGTSAQVLQTNGSGQLSFTNVATPTTVAVVPQPVFAYQNTSVNLDVNSNTTCYLMKFYLPAKITTAKITFDVGTVTVAGTFRYAIFSEDGQTRYLSETSSTVSTTGQKTYTYTGVALEPGYYYISIVPVSTTNIALKTYQLYTNTIQYNASPASEPIFYGETTVSAGTMPTTFNPTSITANAGIGLVVFRLDN